MVLKVKWGEKNRREQTLERLRVSRCSASSEKFILGVCGKGGAERMSVL